MEDRDIRWTKSRRKKLSTYVRKYNAKLTREQRKNPMVASYLPERLNVDTLKNSLRTVKDFEQLQRKVDRVFRPNVLIPVMTREGAKTTKYELNEIKIGVRRINREREKQLKEYTPTPETGTTAQIEKANLKPKVFTEQTFEKMTPDAWGAFVESVEKQALASYRKGKIQQYKENYKRALYSELGSYSDDIIDLIDTIPDDIFVGAMLIDPFLTIDFVYDPQEQEAKAGAIYAHWETYQTEETNG